MMKKESISDHEILTLIHKNIDIVKLKSQNKTITKKIIDQFFQKLKEYVEKDDLSVSDKAGKDVSTINKRFDFLTVNVDGASKGNPGEAGIGVAVFDKDLNIVQERCEYIGVATNNIAEYKALILGVKLAIKFNAKNTLFKSDSELLVKQIMGEYRVKNPQLKCLFTEAQNLLGKLPEWVIKHVPREENREADLLANKGVEMSAENR
jgi:ribonuclease HI